MSDDVARKRKGGLAAADAFFAIFGLKRVKPKRMTKKRWTQLMNEPDDEKARLSPDEVSAGWHWCWEYDGLLVGPDMPEWGKNKGRCICGFKPNELPK